jgi:hypothetical protein
MKAGVQEAIDLLEKEYEIIKADRPDYTPSYKDAIWDLKCFLNEHPESPQAPVEDTNKTLTDWKNEAIYYKNLLESVKEEKISWKEKYSELFEKWFNQKEAPVEGAHPKDPLSISPDDFKGIEKAFYKFSNCWGINQTLSNFIKWINEEKIEIENVGFSKDKILAKVSGHYPDLLIGALLDEESITPNECFTAMESYRNQKYDRIEKVVEYCNSRIKDYNDKLDEYNPDKYDKEVSIFEQVKDFLQQLKQ